jgi:hypothetical protein
MKAAIFSFIFFFTSQIVFAQTSNEFDRNKGWQTDIDTLLSLIKRQHYVYKSKPLSAELLTKAAKLKESVSQFSDERMVFELEKLMYYMHDGHSYVLPFVTKIGPSYCMPLQFYIFSDGVYIINADEPYTTLIGSRVKQINGISIDKILNDMNSYIHQDNLHTVKWFAPTMMRFRGIYEMYGLRSLSKNINLSLVNRKNKPVLQNIEFVPVASLKGIPKLIPSQLPEAPPAPLYLSNVTRNYWLEKNPERNTLYFQFNQAYDSPDESLSQFSAKLDSTLSKLKPRLFVIDVRHNNGGNKDLLRPLIDVIKRFESLNRTAKIVVITGRNTFSAAQVFITLINKETKALFAGEPSASSPNFVGEEGNFFMLPWSGAIGNISTRYHESIPGDKRKWIQPDFPIILSSTSYFENQDPVMDYIRKKFGY